jgi:hypothetical protein
MVLSGPTSFSTLWKTPVDTEHLAGIFCMELGSE